MQKDLECIEDKNDSLELYFNITHLYIISLFFDQMGLTEFVDSILVKSKDSKITHGEAFKFLLLSAFSTYRSSIFKYHIEMNMILRHFSSKLFNT
jgi:hypothetical protein